MRRCFLLGLLLAVLAAAAPAGAGVRVVDPFPLERFADRAAIGLLVPGAGPEVTREGALSALLRGKLEHDLLRSTGPTSVNHARRASRSSASIQSDRSASLLEVALDPGCICRIGALAQGHFHGLQLGNWASGSSVSPARLRTTIRPSDSSVQVREDLCDSCP